MKYVLIKKIVTLFIIFIPLILVNINFIVQGDLTSNNILYVGGEGNGNYSKIQDAINNSIDGYKIFVYSGIYYENLIIDKSIILIGQDKSSTIIDGLNKNHVILLKKNHINISGFTIQNGGNGFAGIFLTNTSNNNIIANNIIKSNNWIGIKLHSSNNLIENNLITSNTDGIFLTYYCKNNNIIKNKFFNNNYYGIYIQSTNNGNNIYNNNFVNNGQNAHDEGINIWDDDWHGNYWDDYGEKYPESRKIFLKGIWNFPYQIPGENNLDRYPLYKEYTESNIQNQIKISNNMDQYINLIKFINIILFDGEKI